MYTTACLRGEYVCLKRQTENNGDVYKLIKQIQYIN